MSCAACGGDGQIAMGAYRGDLNTETRQCILCEGRASDGLRFSWSTGELTREELARVAGDSFQPTIDGDDLIRRSML